MESPERSQMLTAVMFPLSSTSFLSVQTSPLIQQAQQQSLSLTTSLINEKLMAPAGAVAVTDNNVII